mgnify:CR=1 FL=1|jgi:hypothetical protein|tara:strand:- start:45 stop:281 length:237 start_codon:yes stop_codon:yes gene_type:complete
MSRTYVIIDSSEVSSVNFNEVLETSADTLRYNVSPAGTKTFVKFEGDTPSFLEGKTAYTHSEMLTILAGEEWTSPIEP